MSTENIKDHARWLQQEYLFGDRKHAKKIVKSLTSTERDLFIRVINRNVKASDSSNIGKLNEKLTKVKTKEVFSKKTFTESIKAIWDNRFNDRKTSKKVLKEVLQSMELFYPTPQPLKDLSKKNQLSLGKLDKLLTTHSAELTNLAIEKPNQWLLFSKQVRNRLDKSPNSEKINEHLDKLDRYVRQLHRTPTAKRIYLRLPTDIQSLIRHLIVAQKEPLHEVSGPSKITDAGLLAIKWLQAFSETSHPKKIKMLANWISEHHIPLKAFAALPFPLSIDEIKQIIPNLTYLDLTGLGKNGIQDEFGKYHPLQELIQLAEKVETLEFYYRKKIIPWIPHVENIKEINLYGKGPYIAVPMIFDPFVSLEAITFNCTYLSPPSWLSLEKFPQLKKLILYKSHISEEGLRSLFKLNQLESLELIYSIVLKDSTLNWIVSCKNLKKLTLGCFGKDLTEGALSRLQSLSLSHLELRTRTTGDCFQNWNHTESLTHLNLERCSYLQTDSLHHLKKFRNLEYLSLPGELDKAAIQKFQNFMKIPMLTWGAREQRIYPQAKR